MTTNIRRKTAVVAAALAVLGTGCAPSAIPASGCRVRSWCPARAW